MAPVTRQRLVMSLVLFLTTTIGAVIVVYLVTDDLIAGRMTSETYESMFASMAAALSMFGLLFWSLRFIAKGRVPSNKWFVYLGFLLGALASTRMVLIIIFRIPKELDFLTLWIWCGPLLAYACLIHIMHEHRRHEVT